MPSPNQRVSEYILEQKIGGGAFGEVWRGRHHVWSDQVVAVKFPTDPQYVRNLQREGRAIHGLVHPNIVRALGFDPFAEQPYLVMEYVPGTSLRPLIAERKLSPKQAIAVMKQVLNGLAHAHDNGVIHRDIKPENILIHQRATEEGYDSDGMVKVTDFGLGTKSGNPADGSMVFSQSLHGPAAQTIAGTLDYMPPEQRAGQMVDARADLYACGVVLYEMLTGERPAGTDVPSDLNKEAPRTLDEVFRRSYARLDKRYASAGKFIAALSAGSPPPLPKSPADEHRPGAHRICPHCRKGVEPGDQFCMHCGVQLVTRVRRCPKCNAWPGPEDRKCSFCGTDLGQ